MSAIERRFLNIASVVAIATLLLSLFLEHVVASAWHARVRDLALIWFAALLLVFGIRALRRSGRTREALVSTAAGALMFVGLAGLALYGDHVLGGFPEALRPLGPHRESEQEREETERAIEQIETSRQAIRQAAIGWAVSGIGCAALGLLTPIRSRDEADLANS